MNTSGGMDRELPSDIAHRQWARRTARVVLPALAMLAAVAWLPHFVRPVLHRERIRTAIVTTGQLEAVITASGRVVPEIERVLTSPVDARLLRVLKRPGATVASGEPVAELDLFETELAWDHLVTDVRIADNQASKARAAAARQLADLDGRIEKAALTLRWLGTRANGQQRLFAEGLASQQAAEEARIAAEQAAIELAQLRREREHAEEAAALEANGLAYEREALRKETEQARRLLELGTMRSDRPGVVEWVLSQEGSLVRRGDTVARIADFSSFRVDASVSDVHAGRVRPGTPVLVTIREDARLDGTITEVAPSVEGGVVRFRVALRARSHPALRADMDVDVFIITDRKARTLKVARGPYDDGAPRTSTFVLEGNRAVRREVALGLRGSRDVEVVGGLDEGEEIVVSDVRDYLHLEELEVR